MKIIKIQWRNIFLTIVSTLIVIGYVNGLFDFTTFGGDEFGFMIVGISMTLLYALLLGDRSFFRYLFSSKNIDKITGRLVTIDGYVGSRRRGGYIRGKLVFESLMGELYFLQTQDIDTDGFYQFCFFYTEKDHSFLKKFCLENGLLINSEYDLIVDHNNKNNTKFSNLEMDKNVRG